MGNSCKAIEVNWEKIIQAGPEKSLENWCQNALCDLLTDSFLGDKNNIERLVLSYKDWKIDRNFLMRNVPFLLSLLIEDHPMYAEKIIFKLKKLWIDENAIREKIKNGKNLSSDSILEHTEQTKQTIFSFLKTQLEKNPEKSYVFYLISVINKQVEEYASKLPMYNIKDMLLKDSINLVTVYLLNNKDKLKLTPEDFEKIKNLNPDFKDTSNYWTNYKN